MALSLLVSALLAGLVGGLHCAAMCGGFVTALAARDAHRAAAAPLVPLRRLLLRQLGYHAGRVASYAVLGAAFGAAGSATVDAVAFLPLQQGLYVFANVLLLLLAAGIATRTAGSAWLARIGLGVFGKALPRLGTLARGGAASRIALGAAWGFVPCTLVYGVLPLALFAGGAWQGAVLMAVFGLATVPHLVGLGFVLQRVRLVLGRVAVRNAAAIVMIAFAAIGIYRALYLPDSLAQGPFCLVP